MKVREFRQAFLADPKEEYWNNYLRDPKKETVEYAV
jgi:hypothetical protein